MNDFDRFMEFELRQMLDPVVSPAAPRRRQRKGSGSPFLAVISAPLEMAAEALPAVESAAVPVLIWGSGRNRERRRLHTS